MLVPIRLSLRLIKLLRAKVWVLGANPVKRAHAGRHQRGTSHRRGAARIIHDAGIPIVRPFRAKWAGGEVG